MRAISIPIRSADADPDDTLDYLPMLREMSTFEMPRVPEPGPGADVAGARDVLEAFIAHVDRWLAEGGDPPALDVAGLAPDALRVLNETLGEGEVAAIVDAGPPVRIQETVFPGVWRQQHEQGGRLVHDYLLAAPVPPVVVQRAAEHAAPRLRERPLPVGAMNVAPLLHELQDAIDRSGPGVPAHTINLSLLPMSPEDSAHLDAVLDGGAVVLLSRGFGNCRISSTAARHVWRVQYFNNMQTLILNTIEVVDVPAVAVAAREDLVETRARLADLVQWMSDSLATA